MRISFIIPAKNEEKNIRNVISQFRKLKDADYEIIIGDHSSTDGTAKAAKRLGAKVAFVGRKPGTIASVRNAGADIASGDIFVFCDADTLFEDVALFVRNVERIFSDEDVVAAMPRIQVFPEERMWKDRIFSSFLNNLFRFSFLVNYPFSSGQCQVVRASAFRKVDGYNKDQVHAEDSSLFQKLRKHGKLCYMKGSSVLESPRRYRKIGYLRLMWTGVASVVGQKVLGRNIMKRYERVD